MNFYTSILYIVILINLISVPSTFCKQRVILDTDKDARFSWKISDGFVYLSSGSQIGDLMRDKLPPNFSMDTLSKTLGIWVILPSLKPTLEISNETHYTNSVTFGFQTAAQLLESVTIRFNGAGRNSLINVKTDRNHTIALPDLDSPNEDWSEETIPVNINRFTVEAIVHDEGEFILIDKITATFAETTTKRTTKRPKTTTPASINLGNNNHANSLFAFLTGLTCFLIQFKV